MIKLVNVENRICAVIYSSLYPIGQIKKMRSNYGSFSLFCQIYCVLAVGSDLSHSQKPPKITFQVTPLQPSNLFISSRPEGLSCHSSIKPVCVCGRGCRITFPSERKWHHQSQTTNWFPLRLLLSVCTFSPLDECDVRPASTAGGSGCLLGFNESCFA